jgi:N4-gp56 family major capsid protein
MHINREMIFGANEITEDMLQIDLINAAGVVYFAGGATQNSEISGVAATLTEVTYGDLSRLSVELDNNRAPKTTKVISGSRMTDTRVIRGGRVMFMGSELTQTVETMKDYFDNQAFISVAHYADAGSVINGEIGTVGQFRLVVVPEMMHWSGAGLAEGVNAGYRATGGNYDVFPMLVVSDASFTTIGFQTNGKTVKFSIKHAKPGSTESYANDPYGEMGFMSIKWYYGFMALRPERIALLKTVARL